MADITTVGSQDEFVQSIVQEDDLELSDDGARELWRIWQFRYDNGAEDDVLVALPGWFAQDEFGKRRPYFFASIEHDDPDSGAILFSDARLIDVNVVENGIWDQVTVSEALSVLDISDDDDYIDEAGKVWCPRSLMYIFEMESGDEESDGSSGLTDIAMNDD